MGDDFELLKFGLKVVYCVDISGMIFICLVQVLLVIGDMVKQLMIYLVLLGLMDVKVVYFLIIVENGNWKLVFENNCECYYCGGLYLLLCWIYFDNLVMIVMEGLDSVSLDILDYWKCCEVVGLLLCFVNYFKMEWCLVCILLLNNVESYMFSIKVVVSKCMGQMFFNDVGSLFFFYYLNIWNYFLVDYVIVFCILLISLIEMQVIMNWLVYKDVVEGVDYDIEILICVWLNINDEDWLVVEENQKGILLFVYEFGFYLMIQEEGVVQFVDWYCDKMIECLFFVLVMVVE